jgi:hypothetical protein
MRRLQVFLALVVLVAFALGVAWILTDWPHWCRWLHWCDGQGLL